MQLYINGHDHNLQFIKNPKDFTYYVTTGAGSETRPEFGDTNTALFQHPEAGFVDVKVTKYQVKLQFFNETTARPMFAANLSPEGGIKVAAEAAAG